MKMRIVDLMDNYSGDGIQLDPPERIAQQRNGSAQSAPTAAPAHCGKRPLLAAAALLLVVTAAAATPFFLSRTAGNEALGEGAASAESIQNELPSEFPTEVPAAAADSGLEAAETPETWIAPHTITGAAVQENEYGGSLLSGNNGDCYGNIVNIDGTYYTLTESGPELLETTNLHTTVELYGTWELDIDYAIVGGELAFHDNSFQSSYAMIDGEKVMETDYIRENGYTAACNIQWITPDMATAFPVEGSPDTVRLMIQLADKTVVNACSYDFFYNIFTGEIFDPLGNVPNLFDHGQFSHAEFNSAHTRAILSYFEYRQMPDGEILQGEAHDYICDLTTGEMTLLEDLAAPYMPEPEHEGSSIHVGSGPCWAADDTLMFSAAELYDNGKEFGFDEEKGEFIHDVSYIAWLYSYDMVTGTLNYQLRDVELTSVSEGNDPYPYIYPEEDSCCQFFETATGKTYLLNVPMEIYGAGYGRNRKVYRTAENEIYLVDLDAKAWVKLSGYMELPDLSGAGYCYMKLLTEDWLCLMYGDSVYSYHIPDDLPMLPLEES